MVEETRPVQNSKRRNASQFPSAHGQNRKTLIFFRRGYSHTGTTASSAHVCCAHQFIRIPNSIQPARCFAFALWPLAAPAPPSAFFATSLSSRTPALPRGRTGHGSPIRSGDVHDRRLPGQGRRRVVRGLDLTAFSTPSNPASIPLTDPSPLRFLRGVWLQLLLLLRLLLQHPGLPLLLVLIDRCRC